jgi:hypothetical protein
MTHGGAFRGYICKVRNATRAVPVGGLEGLEVHEDFEGAEVQAVGGIDAPLNTVEGIEGVVVGMAEWGIVFDGFVEEVGIGEVFVQAFDVVVPELGFDAAEAALGPLGGDKGIGSPAGSPARAAFAADFFRNALLEGAVTVAF